MRLVLGTLLGAVLAAGCQRGEPLQSTRPPVAAERTQDLPPDSNPQSRALAARDALFERLSARLVEAMSTGGPAAAIVVCSREAPLIAADVGVTQGVAIGRTSFKLRNPDNGPPDWAKALIDARTSEPRFVELPAGETGALLPIRLKAQCLACHGQPDQIAESVRAKLAELYPQDEATGFKEGDLRGWFWVVVPATD